MRADRLFPEGTVPEWTTAAWYARRDTAPHVDQAEHRPRLLKTADMVHGIAEAERHDDWEADFPTVVDLGAGDGGLLSLLGFVDRWGYDLQPSNVQAAERRLQRVFLADVLTDTIAWGHIAVCTEMLEHLIDPAAFLRRIAESGSRWLVCSSPWTETADAHYEYHCWAWDQDGYRRLLEGAGWVVVEHATVGMFQVASCRLPE